jgi:Mrp family chromosome partitioning ATPase
MAKKHADLRDALFDTSGYLADLLTRCAFIEEQFYRGPGPVLQNVEKERSIVRVYTAILQYSAEVRKVQQFGTANDIVESITGVASEQLAKLKTSIKEEELQLHHWLLLDQHLHRKVEAEAILTHIDGLKVDIQKVHDAVNMLNLPFADGAFFDSFIDQHEDECLPGTRAELLQQVQQWGKSSDRCIFWLSGMAGTGKSTIARTVARRFKENGILGASFFFKRGRGDQGSAVKFFPTIVKQLATRIPQMITGVQKALLNDPAISGKSLREQFDKLMLQPLLAVDRGQSSASIVVVIDALDECEREEDVEVILELLPKVEKATCLRIRFFLTSRPESSIRFGFDQIDQSDYQNTVLQNLDTDVIKHDITLYLREELRRIRQRHQRDLPSNWPGEERIEALATMAVPLFIFAATVCRFVDDRKWNPERRLQQFFNDSSGSKMDKTYRPILHQLLAEDESEMNQLVEEFQKTVGVIILLATPLSLSALAELVEMPEGEISTRLDAFHSVLTIPNEPNLPIQTLHLSFHDYLVDKHTKAQESTSRFWVDKKKNHEYVARQCLTVMGRYLKKNICGLPSYGTSRTEIDPDSIARFLPPVLQYTCRYWVHHLAQSSLSAKTIDQILPFLEEHFLHWLEVMAISGIISECLNAMDTLLQLTKVSLLQMCAQRTDQCWSNIGYIQHCHIVVPLGRSQVYLQVYKHH